MIRSAGRILVPMCVAVLLASLLPVAAFGSDAKDRVSNWTAWRGPQANGTAAPDATPPLHWDPETNLQWTTTLPGSGTSTPIVWKHQIFLLSAEATERKSDQPVVKEETSKTIPPDIYYRFIVTCVDRRDGKTLWQQRATEQVPHEGRHPTHTYAAGSPTTDGERLYVSFGSRGIFCYSLDGELIWERDLGNMRTRFGWGEAVSPALAGDLLIVNWDQEQDSFITALNKHTGEIVWKVDRPGEVTSWTTPLVTEFDGRRLIIVNGTERARAYDAATGSEIWACGGQTVNSIPSVVRYEDTVVCMSGYRGAAAFAIPLNSKGDITGSTSVLWQYEQGTPYVPSPGLSDHRLFFTAANTNVMTCLDVRSGKPLIDRRRINGLSSLYASPMIANGHLYFLSREGVTAVLKDNETLDEVSLNTLEGTFDASPVAVDHQLLLRSWDKLFCIAELN